MGAVVPAVDEGSDLGVEVLDRLEHAPADGLALYDAEPDLDLGAPSHALIIHVSPFVRVGRSPDAAKQVVVGGFLLRGCPIERHERGHGGVDTAG